MNICRDKLKRMLVFGSIALAWLPCLQQSHIVCRIANCLQPPDVAHAVIDLPSERGCCNNKAESPGHAPTPTHSDAPCGPDCWCCQPPEPREVPRDITQTFQSRNAALLQTGPSAAVVGQQIERPDEANFAATESLASNSGRICAQFCRFLI
jgi:hypothetical protein